jgi:hypothetical protein
MIILNERGWEERERVLEESLRREVIESENSESRVRGGGMQLLCDRF